MFRNLDQGSFGAHGTLKETSEMDSYLRRRRILDDWDLHAGERFCCLKI